jgi:2-desacetyl-2-hydroxyethyl bacteriochlorophyllide A dehydrogenase
MDRHSLFFTAPSRVEVVQETLPKINPNQVQVKTLFSAISPGTETMIYRGDFPAGEEVDATISSLPGTFDYPFRYGYSLVGEVIDAGSLVDQSWLGRTVFSFHPHTSCFNAMLHDLIPVPDDLHPEPATFLANMETAVNLILDGAPLIGEHVLLFGQGLVGLFTTSLLSNFPLKNLITLDLFPKRREISLGLGATASFDPSDPGVIERIKQLIPDYADLSYELSGNPQALNQAISLSGFSGRVVVGSWYGKKAVNLELGGGFHRNRIHLISSQVSTLPPHLSGRWDKNRRYQLAWDGIRQIDPTHLITHRFDFQQAEQAYKLLDQQPEKTVGIIFSYQ